MRQLLFSTMIVMLTTACATSDSAPPMMVSDMSRVAPSGASFGYTAWDGILESGEVASRKMAASSPVADRKIVYTASLAIMVSLRSTAIERIGKLAEEKGGIVSRSSLRDITIRVPPDQLQATLREIEALGEVLDRNVSSDDITESYRDVEGRLSTAKASRDRLLKLLETAEETKDVLLIEQDLRRLTEEIEQIERSLRGMDNQVQFATIQISVEERAREQVNVVRPPSPFTWMEKLGIDEVMATRRNPSLSGPRRSLPWLLHGNPFRLATGDDRIVPEGFVPIEYRENLLVAATAGDARLRVTRFRVEHEQSLEFWSTVLRREFERQRGYEVTDTKKLFLETGLDLIGLETETVFGGERWVYNIMLIQKTGDKKQLCAVEFAYPKREDVTPLGMALYNAVLGFRVR
ncbi:DUF4349 domain-containing protein [bacterium]|nr:DUF4349 domain-containing protein [bacterium]